MGYDVIHNVNIELILKLIEKIIFKIEELKRVTEELEIINNSKMFK